MSDVMPFPKVDELSPQPSPQTLLSLARARVYKRLQAAVDFPICVVCAPAGFGKSTVLREFFAASGRPYRRLHVTSGQGDLLGFMREVANRVGDLVPALRVSFMSVYERIHRADAATREIASWAAGHLAPIELSLIVDGLKHVTDERLFGLLSELIDTTSHMRIRWILVVETADQFPIARWLANGSMELPLDEVDLALTSDDLVAAADLSNATIAHTALREVCRTAANWPAAVALALSNVGALSTVAGEPVLARSYAYFAKLAFSARSDGERRFLVETCLYKHFNAPLLEAAGWDNVEPMLYRLRETGAILFTDDDGSYRYHELFRALLEEQLRASSPGLYRQIATASAGVYRRVGRWSDALELYTGLQAAEPLAELLSEHGFELMDRGEADLVSRCLGALSDADFAAYPIALAVKASLESLHGSLDVAEAWFRHAINNVRDSSQRGSIVFRFATDLVRQDRQEAIDLLQSIVAEEGHELGLSVSLAGLLATAYATHQQSAQAAQTIDRALKQMDDVADLGVRAKLYFQAGYVAFFARDPVRAKGFAQQAVEAALRSHLYDIAARALSILYNVAIDYEDDLCAGRLYLDELASCSVKAGSGNLLVYAKLGQFEIEVFRGNLDASARLDAELQSLEVDYSVFASETLLPAQALRATWSGDFHRAYRLIAPTAEKQITPMRQSQRYAEIGLYAAAAGLPTEAAAAISRALAITYKGDRAGKYVASTEAYVSLALTLLGDYERAAQMLSKLSQSSALTPRLEQFVNAIRIINDRWALGRYSTDLRDTLDRLDACDFGGIGRLIEALPLPQTSHGQWAELSAPEREVLIHMSAGLNAGAVAALSGQTVETIDALTTSLCRKLGCTSARHAVALARSADGCATSP